MHPLQDSYRKKMDLGQDGNALIQLIVLNAVVFVVLKFIYSIYLLSAGHNNLDNYYKNIFSWFVLPADAGKMSARPWTLVTYMFSDEPSFKYVAAMVMPLMDLIIGMLRGVLPLRVYYQLLSIRYMVMLLRMEVP